MILGVLSKIRKTPFKERISVSEMTDQKQYSLPTTYEVPRK